MDYNVYPIWEPGIDKIIFNKDTNKVEDVSDIQITIENGIKSQFGQNFSWDQYVFALHFNDDEHRMICQQGQFTHDILDVHSGCLRKQPSPENRRIWKCPDEI